MKVLICGGRGYFDRKTLRRELDRLLTERRISLVVTGGAPGADYEADQWAKLRHLDRVIVPANWTGRGKAGGPFRNQLMLDLVRPDLVVAFPGGPGTAGMIELAERAGVPVRRIEQ